MCVYNLSKLNNTNQTCYKVFYKDNDEYVTPFRRTNNKHYTINKKYSVASIDYRSGFHAFKTLNSARRLKIEISKDIKLLNKSLEAIYWSVKRGDYKVVICKVILLDDIRQGIFEFWYPLNIVQAFCGQSMMILEEIR
jgi:hypothetical protein